MAYNTCEMQQILFMGCNRQPSYVLCRCPLASDKDLNTGDILVKILCAAICPADLEKINNAQLEDELPCGLGHEGVGEIVLSKRISEDDSVELVAGDRVIFCSALCTDHENVNKTKDNTEGGGVLANMSTIADGTRKLHFGSTFATHCILKPDAHVIKLPNHIPSTVGAIINCPLAKMTSALEILQFQNCHPRKDTSTPNVAIVQGTTVTGLYGCAFLRENGFNHVIVVESNHTRWKLIEDFGGLPTSDLLHDANVMNLLQNSRVKLVIDTFHCKHFCVSTLNLLCSGGIYLLAGTTSSSYGKLEIPAETIIQKNLLVRGICNYTAEHLKQVVDFLSRTIERYPYEELVSNPFPFSNINDAIKRAYLEQPRRIVIQPTR